jgi:sugar/nucleoside kinase (ribokinase family)
MSRSFDILGFGAVAVDDLLYVNSFPAAEGKVRVKRRLRQCGGLTGTALVAAARLGARAAYVGVIGDDPLSEEVVRALREAGVETAFATRRPDARPAHSTIVVDETHHTRTIFSSADGLLGADEFNPPADLIQSARVLLIDHHGMPGSRRAVALAREMGIPVVADFERNGGPGFEPLIEEVGHLIVGQDFAQEWTGQRTPQRACQALWSPNREVVVVTCGAAGCWYVARESISPDHCPAYEVSVLDTTGCGDVFHGAYAVALSCGHPLLQRLRYASIAAGLKATGRGGQAAIPSKADVEAAERSIQAL